MTHLERPLVIKFGGTSVGGGAQFVRAARIAAGAAGDNPVAVVVSAMSGTTDTLLGYARMSSGWVRQTLEQETHEASIAELRRMLAERHLHAAREAVAAEYRPGVEGRIVDLLGELEEAIGATYDNLKARRDEIAVYGERLSAEILAGAISSQGAPAVVVTADPIATDTRFGEAEVDPAATRERSARSVTPLLESGLVAVVPGYVGRSPGGAPTTLGRGGSDLSATVLGRALGSGEVWIMSDVDGVLDADPRLVPDAHLMPRLSYREAGIFAGLGAKVLHPRTMEPASEAGIEVYVRNTFAPEGAGTHVTGFDPGPASAAWRSGRTWPWRSRARTGAREGLLWSSVSVHPRRRTSPGAVVACVRPASPYSTSAWRPPGSCSSSPPTWASRPCARCMLA